MEPIATQDLQNTTGGCCPPACPPCGQAPAPPPAPNPGFFGHRWGGWGPGASARWQAHAARYAARRGWWR